MPKGAGWIDWRKSEARKILIEDLEEGGRLAEKDVILAEEEFKYYSKLPEFSAVVFSQFKARLKDHKERAIDRKGWIDWRNSEPRRILIEDLQPGGILFEKEAEVSAEEAFRFYATEITEFSKVVFSQFKHQLSEHRNQASELAQISREEEWALIHDRKLFPRQGHNERGEPVFDMSKAKMLLREDVAAGVQSTVKPSEFQKTRPEYMAFKLSIFKGRIYQEEKRQKFLHMLEIKRSSKLRRKK